MYMICQIDKKRYKYYYIRDSCGYGIFMSALKLNQNNIYSFCQFCIFGTLSLEGYVFCIGHFFSTIVHLPGMQF